MKKLAALAVFGALIGSALPAGAVTVPGSVTVKWNTAIVATLALNNNYSAAGASQVTAPVVVQNVNGGSGSCAGPASEVAATVNFGTVTPDAAQTTSCLYDNAVDAKVSTNSTSWQMTEALSATVTGTLLCALGNGTTFPFATGAALPVTQSTRTTNAGVPAGAACPAGSLALTAVPANAVSPNPSITAYPNGAHIGEDLMLMVSPTGSTGNQSITLNYSLVAN